MEQLDRGLESVSKQVFGYRRGMKRNMLYHCIGSVAVIVLSLVAHAEADVFGQNDRMSSGRWDDRRQGQEVLPNIRHKVTHDPEGPTLNHDYYKERTNPNKTNLVYLVENAHVSKILPNLRKSFTAQEPMKTGFLKQALNEIEYTLGRLVNHPKALALSASVTKLLGRPRLPISFYQRAITLYPRRAFTQAQFGNFLVELGDIEEGIERLKIAIKLNPKLGVAHAWLAWAYQKNGDVDLAVEYSKNAKEKGFKGKLPKTQ